ncbi:hypothetical protein SAMN04487917_11416 [Arthrobacter sp. yr096]|uniref:hypothetical protein n=1 Tax=unclassified Arthrobacter TaxID=235627 RepID=UPI000896B680|nr:MULTISPECIES: hypothetical protein [unclassified Arthrobacter]SDX57574.1 hypothetical protein SAMN04487912_11813 [Arthrobacter sp. cf158]SEJ79791.1 hypothetical protein SAMN04487917_11416 [Arthrobacter sp. yr096]
MRLLRRKRAALMVALPLALVFPASNPPAVTEASWERGEYSSGSFGTITIPPPTLNGACTYNPGIIGLGAYVRIFWKPPAGYTLANSEMQASTSGLGSLLAPLTGFSITSNTTGSAAAGYVTDVPVNLLGGLLGLGTELQLAIVIKDPVNLWISKPASVATNAGLIAGLGGNCRNLPAA